MNEWILSSRSLHFSGKERWRFEFWPTPASHPASCSLTRTWNHSHIFSGWMLLDLHLPRKAPKLRDFLLSWLRCQSWGREYTLLLPSGKDSVGESISAVAWIPWSPFALQHFTGDVFSRSCPSLPGRVLNLLGHPCFLLVDCWCKCGWLSYSEPLLQWTWENFCWFLQLSHITSPTLLNLLR